MIDPVTLSLLGSLVFALGVLLGSACTSITILGTLAYIEWRTGI